MSRSEAHAASWDQSQSLELRLAWLSCDDGNDGGNGGDAFAPSPIINNESMSPALHAQPCPALP